MLIESVEIKNYRSIKDGKLDCDNLTVLLGRNGAGKSSFLNAIDIFYDISADISDEDFYDRDTKQTIEIRITFHELKEEEKQEFSTYIRENKLIVTKKILKENGKFLQRYYAASLQLPNFFEIRSAPGKRDKTTKWKELVDSNTIADLPTDTVRSADDVEQLMQQYEQAHQELLQPIEKEEQFFGAKSVGGGKLDKYTKFVLIPAVRKATDEVSGKKGAIYQILDMIVLRKINAREDIQTFKSRFEQEIQRLFSSENLTELPELAQSISTTLEKFAPGAKLNLKWKEITSIDLPIPEPIATLVEDNFEGEITHKGHGLQRALIVTLLQHLAMLPTPEEGNEEDLKTSGNPLLNGPDLILAIEEPELYLHPGRCRYLSSLLLKLVEHNELGLGTQNQILYTTHSPYFVDLHRFDKIRKIRKIQTTAGQTPFSSINSYKLAEAAQKLAEITDSSPDTFTRDTFKTRAMSVMTTVVNEGFFADKIVVVEGPTDVCTLWKLQELLGQNWSEKGIFVVPAGGKNNIDRPVVIFKGLSIPTYFIFDTDSKLTGKNRNSAKIRNHRYLKLAGDKTEDFPKTTIKDTYAVFNSNLEDIFKQELGEKFFHQIQEDVANELGYEDCGKACKNIEGAARFIELVYEKGCKIKILEKIIEKVTILK